MKPKTIKIKYWITLVLFAGFMLVDGISGIAQVEQGKEILVHLGYPVYLLTITGIAKLLGSITLFQPKFRTLKEWAYAGFTINFLGAFASRLFVHDSIMEIISPLLFLAFMLLNYYLWKKTQQIA